MVWIYLNAFALSEKTMSQSPFDILQTAKCIEARTRIRSHKLPLSKISLRIYQRINRFILWLWHILKSTPHFALLIHLFLLLRLFLSQWADTQNERCVLNGELEVNASFCVYTNHSDFKAEREKKSYLFRVHCEGKVAEWWSFERKSHDKYATHVLCVSQA